MTQTLIAGQTTDWPDDVAQIYQEIAEEDQRLTEAMWPGIKATWPDEKEHHEAPAR